MNIFDVHQKTGVAMRTLRKMERLGVLSVDKLDENTSRIISNLRNGNPLSVEQLFYFLRNPDASSSLPFEQWAPIIDSAIDTLGDVAADAMPWTPYGAALPLVWSGDETATALVCGWLRSMIDSSAGFDGSERDHAYVSVRLLHNVPDDKISLIVPKIKWIMWRCREHPSMTSYVRRDMARRVHYHRPFNI
jgi:hypothetical protein